MFNTGGVGKILGVEFFLPKEQGGGACSDPEGGG